MEIRDAVKNRTGATRAVALGQIEGALANALLSAAQDILNRLDPVTKTN